MCIKEQMADDLSEAQLGTRKLYPYIILILIIIYAITRFL